MFANSRITHIYMQGSITSPQAVRSSENIKTQRTFALCTSIQAPHFKFSVAHGTKTCVGRLSTSPSTLVFAQFSNAVCDRKKRWCIDKTSDDLCKEGGGPKSVITFMHIQRRQHIPPIKAIILSIVNPITSFPHAHFDVCIWVKQFILVCVATRTGSSSSMVESVAISGNFPPPPPSPLGEKCRK